MDKTELEHPGKCSETQKNFGTLSLSLQTR